MNKHQLLAENVWLRSTEEHKNDIAQAFDADPNYAFSIFEHAFMKTGGDRHEAALLWMDLIPYIKNHLLEVHRISQVS